MKKKELSVEPSFNEDSWFEKESEAKLKKTIGIIHIGISISIRMMIHIGKKKESISYTYAVKS